MTYDQLLAFLAVAQEGGFIAASTALHKSQPAVSKLVRNLEDELGFALFERGRYRATLSDAGRLFLERAAAVAEQTAALASFAKQLRGDIEPVVRLAVEAVTPLAPVLAVLRRAQARFASVRFELSTERLAGAGAALEEGRVDLVIATRLGIRASRVESARFRSVRILPVVRSDHPLAARSGSPPATRTAAPAPPPAQLRAHPQIILRDSTQSGDAASLNVLEGGLRWSVTDVAAKKQVILAGMGWGGLPEHVVVQELASGELVALSVPEFEADRMDLFVMRWRGRPYGVVAGVLWEEISGTRVSDGVGDDPEPSALAPATSRRSPRAAAARTRRGRAVPDQGVTAPGFVARSSGDGGFPPPRRPRRRLR